MIDGCTSCDEKKVSHFSLKDNGFKCENCAKPDKSAIKLSDTTIKAIRYIIKSDAKKIYSFDLSDENKTQLKMVAKLYLNKCLDKEYE